MDNTMDKKVSEIPAMEVRLGHYYTTLMASFRTGNGDPEMLVSLVEAAKGKRSQRKFAEDLGVNVSSISRILSGKVSEISNELLAKIAANADPDSGVTLEQLMAAQGMVEAKNRSELESKLEENCRRIIADELLSRGFTVSYADNAQMRQSRYLCDFEIETNALGKAESRWLFEVKSSLGTGKLPAGMGSTRVWLDSAMAAYYRGEKIGRVSMVVDRKVIFDQVKQILQETPIRDEISVILVSVGGGKILEEFVAPMTDGRAPEFTFEGGSKD